MAVPVREACLLQYPGYIIRSNGTVYSEKTKRMLTHAVGNNGYASLEISANGKGKRLLMHRLVAMAFIPNPNNYPQVNHKNEIRHDNRVENLEWCTAYYNMHYGNCQRRVKANRHYTKDGLKKFQRAGTRAVMKPVINLDTGKVYECAAYAAKELGAYSDSHISSVCKGKRKRALGYRWSYYESR